MHTWKTGSNQKVKLEQALKPALIAGLSMKADQAYHQTANQEFLPDKALVKMKTGIYNFYSDSFTLDAILGFDEAKKVLHSILNHPTIAPWILEYPYVNLDQCWVRRQFPKQYKTHKPHGWHQDGSLAFPFLDKNADYESGILDMLILWIPFSNCGHEAPSLEFVEMPIDRVLGLAELQEDNIDQKYATKDRSFAVLNKGDVLLFDGTLLHRTFVDESMDKARTSLGIRLFKTIPERCKQDRYFNISQD